MEDFSKKTEHMRWVQTVILRHPKERLSKCSLQPLVGREDIEFIKANIKKPFDSTGYILLTVNAPVLSSDDEGPLLLLDSTWRLLSFMEKCITGTPIRRSLPPTIKTAFPRMSKVFQDPAQGLASIEALYVAKKILGAADVSLLESYYWKETFLAQFS